MKLNGQGFVMPRQTRNRIAVFLREIYLGDEGRFFPGGDARQSGSDWPGWKRLHADENGKITLISTITLMFFLMLVCYIGNVGVSVKQKLELQNAADAAAYSTALWQARGMNAVTVANHMLGEATAMAVILESLGGRVQTEYGTGSSQPNYLSRESSNFNSQIAVLQPLAPIALPAALRSPDKRVVDFVADLLTDDDGRHNAGATIYDSKLTLKYFFLLCLKIKSACSVGEVIGSFPPLVFIKIACVAIDIAITAGPVLKIGQEWLFLEALENATLLLVPFHQTVQQALIPAIGMYGTSVAGMTPLTAPGPVGDGSSPLNQAVESSLADLQDFYTRQAIDLAVVPRVQDLELPVQLEEPPPQQGNAQGTPNVGNWEVPPSQWEGPFFTSTVATVIDDAFTAVDTIAGTASDVIGTVLDLASSIPGFETEPFAEARQQLNQLRSFLVLPSRPDYRNGYPQNPCQEANSPYRIWEFYWQHERKSQWVRATYPYVVSFREPMLDFMENGFGGLLNLDLANAATYYTHWSNRYTLAKSWEIRSGVTALNSGLVPRMLILKDSDPDTKGFEPWTHNNRLAEELFVVYAVASRSPSNSTFASVLFPKSNPHGSLAISAAMVYNANPRNLPAQQNGLGTTQRNNGWDTLNWLPPVQSPEWGGQHPLPGGDFWSVFQGNLPANRGAQVQINWQAKLVPLTFGDVAPRKLGQEFNDASSELSEHVRELGSKALEDFLLINH